MCGRRRPEIVVAVVRLVCCRRSLLMVFRRCPSAGLWGLGLRTVLLHRLPRGLQHGRIVPATRQLSAVPGLSALLQSRHVFALTIATRSSSSARAPHARPAHRAVYASVCPNMTGTAACILQNRASTVVSLCRVARPASRAASASDASGANDASRRLCGRRLFEGSASVVIYTFALGLSARGGRYVRGGMILSSPLSWWWSCIGARDVMSRSQYLRVIARLTQIARRVMTALSPPAISNDQVHQAIHDIFVPSCRSSGLMILLYT